MQPQQERVTFPRGSQEHALLGSGGLYFIVVDDELLLEHLDRVESVGLLLFGQHDLTEVTLSEDGKEVEVVKPDLPLSRLPWRRHCLLGHWLLRWPLLLHQLLLYLRRHLLLRHPRRHLLRGHWLDIEGMHPVRVCALLRLRLGWQRRLFHRLPLRGHPTIGVDIRRARWRSLVIARCGRPALLRRYTH